MAALIPFTSNYTDVSTYEGYQFEFCCQRCGNGYRSTFRHSVTGFGGRIAALGGSLLGGEIGSKVEEVGLLAQWDRNGTRGTHQRQAPGRGLAGRGRRVRPVPPVRRVGLPGRLLGRDRRELRPVRAHPAARPPAARPPASGRPAVRAPAVRAPALRAAAAAQPYPAAVRPARSRTQPSSPTVSPSSYGQAPQFGQQQSGQAPQFGQQQFGQAPQFGQQQFGQPQPYGQQQAPRASGRPRVAPGSPCATPAATRAPPRPTARAAAARSSGRFCGSCGSPIAPPTCSGCGAPSQGTAFCTSCGTPTR